MAGRLPHVFEVVVLSSGPDALLGGHRPVVVPKLLAQKDPFELVHSGIGEEQGRVLPGDQRRTGNDLVAPLGKIIEKGPANLV